MTFFFFFPVSVNLKQDLSISIYVHRSFLIESLLLLRDSTATLASSLIDITAVDHVNRNLRFAVSYFLLSYFFSSRFILTTSLKEWNALSTAYSVFRSSIWSERELWDMFGILFFSHPDLRRILTDYGFRGHPLRKNFPVSGYWELSWSEDCSRVVYDYVELSQELPIRLYFLAK